MANEFVRNVKGVRNINKLSRNITTENDLISTNDNEVYVVTNAGYKKITGGDTEQDIQLLETDVKNLKTQSDSNTSDIETLKTSTGNNTSDIETLKTSTGNNTSDIDTLKKSTSNNETNINSTQTLIQQLQTQINDLKANTKQYYTLFDGSSNGVGSILTLDEDIYTFDIIHISGTYGGGTFNASVLMSTMTGNINIQRLNLSDSDGTFLGVYEIKITVNSGIELEITNDVSWDERGSIGSGPGRNAYTIKRIEGVK